MKSYEFLEHTADIGIRVKAKSLEGLFTAVALAMFDIACRKSKPATKKKPILVKLSSADLPELFVNWLNELLSLSATRQLIFSDFKIKKLNNTTLEAAVSGADTKNYKMKTEIKAATYHQLRIEEDESGWIAEVIFDV